MQLLTHVLLVAAGSAVGGLTRWGVGNAAGRLFGTALPFGTFFINVTGSFFLGWFLTVLAERLGPNGFPWLRGDNLRLLVGVGFTGAYTTFSTFEWEAHSLLGDGDTWAGTIYLILSVVIGLIAVRLGVVTARAV